MDDVSTISTFQEFTGLGQAVVLSLFQNHFSSTSTEEIDFHVAITKAFSAGHLTKELFTFSLVA